MGNFQITVVPLGGGWKSYNCRRYREAVARAYLLAREPSCRKVHISKLLRCGIYRVEAYVVGRDGFVWYSRTNPMSELAWKGVHPEPGTAINLVGRFEIPPPDYVI